MRPHAVAEKKSAINAVGTNWLGAALVPCSISLVTAARVNAKIAAGFESVPPRLKKKELRQASMGRTMRLLTRAAITARPTNGSNGPPKTSPPKLLA